MDIKEKQCTKCKKIKPISEFRKDKYKKDGYKNSCKYCEDHRYRLICQQCGEEFYGSHKTQKYCSKKCRDKSKINKIKFNCDYCGKESETIESEYNRHKNHYCSKECGYKHRSSLYSKDNHPNWKGGGIVTTCDYCGKEIIIPLDRFKRSNNNFCDMKCLGKYKSINNLGSNNPNWNPNLTEIEREIDRNIEGYTEFIKKVLERDNYTCQCCGEKEKVSGQLNVHHLDGYNWCKEKRTDETNGITLCKSCHKKFHSIYGRGDNTKEQFEEWIKNNI